VSGSLSHPHLAADVDAERVAGAGQRLDSIQGQVTWTGSRLQWTDLAGTQGAGSFRSTGSLDAQQGAVELSVEGTGLTVAECPANEALCRGGVPITATIERITAVLHGPVRQLTGTVTVAAGAVAWHGSNAGSLSLDATLAEGLATLRASASDLGLSVAGTVSLPAPSPFDLTFAAGGADAARVLRFAEQPALAARIDARVSGTFRATGDLEHLSDLTVDALLPPSSLVVDGRAWSTSGPVHAVYGPERIEVSGLTLATGESRLSATGGLSPDGSRTLALEAEGTLEDLAAFAAHDGPDVTGHVTARMRVTGPPGTPRIVGEARLTAGRLVRPGLSLAIDEMTLSVQDGFVRVDRALISAWGAHASVTAAVPVALFADTLPEGFARAFGDPPGGSRATLGADVSWALADTGLVSDANGPLRGSLAARVDLEADRLEVPALRGTATVRSVELAVGHSRVTQAAEARLALSNGRVTLAPWRLTGAGTDLVAEGSLDVGRDGTLPLNGTVRGPLTLEPLQAVLGVPVSGILTSDVRVSGTATEPRAEGSIAVTGGAVRIRSPRVALADVSGSITLTGRAAELGAISGLVNGAPFTLSGAVALPGATGPTTQTLRLQAERVPVQPFANGPRAETDLDLVFSDTAGDRRITGHAELLPQPFRGSILALKQFVDTVAAANAPLGDAPRRRRAGTSPVKLDIKVTSREPLLVDTSAGRVELAAGLTIAGSVDQPSLLGRVTILEDGVIRAGGRTYTISEGTIDFKNPRRIAPLINLTATTRISTYAITMVLAGTPDSLQTSLSSDPPLAETDLRSLIVTGRLASQSNGRQNNQDEERTVVESISGDVFGFAAQAIGLDAVSIGSNPDLDLLASDIDARTSLNLTKSLSRQLQIVYSRDLQEDRSSWLVIYRPTRALSFRVLSRDNREGAVEFRQEIRFGAPPGTTAVAEARPSKKPRITRVTFTGDRGVPDEQLYKVLRLGAGDRFDTWRWRGETERLARFYRERGYFTARVVPRRETDADGVALEYAVRQGPRTTLAIDGHKMPPEVVEAMRDAWSESVSTAFLVEDLERVARTHLIDDGYLTARVRAEVPVQTPAAVAVLLHVNSGPVVPSRHIDASVVSPAMKPLLGAYLESSELDRTAWYDPASLKVPVEQFYRDRGYLDVKVVPGEVEVQGTKATLKVAITEGPLYRVSTITVDGADVLGVERVRAATGVTPDVPWQAAFVNDSLKRVENAYHAAGFPDTEVYVEPQVDQTAKRVILYVAVAEGQRQVLQDLSIAGTHATTTKTVSDLVNLKFGSPVTPALISDVQKRLYDVGVFNRVLVDFTPAPGGSQATSVHDDPVIAKVTVFEAPRYSVQYGVQISRTIQATSTESEYKPGGSIDFRDRNFLGRALGLGLGVRADAREQSGRMTLTMPRTYGTSIRSFLFLDHSKETSIPETGFEESDNNSSVTVEQRWRRSPRLEFSWGLAYDFRDVGLTKVGDPPIALLDLRGDTVGPRLAAVWDSRDDPFDSKRGFFHSFGFDVGVPQIGSDLAYTRFLVQNFLFVPRGPLVFASGLRYGGLHAWGSDSPIELDLLFEAGGARSVRGYREDSLAAIQIAGVPLGGRQMLVLNQEVRFPIWWWFKGATFVDAGNTFAHTSDVRLGDLKVGAGWGLRLATPLALIRFDVGYPVNNGPKHAPRYYFTIGQAF
jgi:outer membrane protein assembly factor BamA